MHDAHDVHNVHEMHDIHIMYIHVVQHYWDKDQRHFYHFSRFITIHIIITIHMLTIAQRWKFLFQISLNYLHRYYLRC